MKKLTVISFTLLVCVLSKTVHALPEYKIVELNTVSITTTPTDINDKGQVIGFGRNATTAYDSFLYENGIVTTIGISGINCIAGALNENGQIIGHCGNAGFIYENSQLMELSYDVEMNSFIPKDINDNGKIIGHGNYLGQTNVQAFLYDKGQMIPLRFLLIGSKSQSVAEAYNNKGQAVGYSKYSDSNTEATLFQDGEVVQLGFLGGLNSKAYSINEHGQIVGFSQNTTSTNEAFLYEDGQMQGLGTFSTEGRSIAYDINDNGQIVGFSDIDIKNPQAFLYEEGQMYLLSDLITENKEGWGSLTQALAINNLGEIVGKGIYNGVQKGFLLTQVGPPMFSCKGFEYPLNTEAVTVKKNRTLPFKAQLLDKNNAYISDLELVASPVIQVLFKATSSFTTIDVTDDALSARNADEGNLFSYLDSKWRFNLGTKSYTSSGSYTVTMVSGDSSEYIVSPTCSGFFVIHSDNKNKNK